MTTNPYALPPERLFDRLTSSEIGSMASKQDVLLIVPCGATEQHGPHLPVSVDTKIGLTVLAGALQNLPATSRVYCLPELAYGTSVEHLDFPGTISLSLETYIALLKDIVRSLYISGFRRVMLLTSHGGQVALLEMLSFQLKRDFPELRLFPLFLWNAPLTLETIVSEKEIALGIHAGDIETSIMRAIDPSIVRFDLAVEEFPRGVDEKSLFQLHGKLTRAWATSDVSRTGVLGDATAATAEKGQKLKEMLVSAWTEIIAEACRT